MLPAVLPAASSSLQPLYTLDHAVAIGAWILLYMLEVATVSRILKEHPGQPQEAARTIRSTMTLPKRLMPLSLTSAKRAIYKLVTGNNMVAATGTSANSNMGSNQPNAFTTGDFAREAARRAQRNASGLGGSSSGTGLLDRPADVVTPPPPPPIPEAIVVPKPQPKPIAPDETLKRLPGPIKEGETTETKREKELRERKAYLKNFWYAVGISEELKDKPMEVNILGRTVTLFREHETGAVRCVENLCPHRGAPLSKGWTQDVNGHTCVVCPYHAWAFDGQGRLQDVPAATKGQLPKRSILNAYPVEEKGGFIWLFFGSNSMPAEERPPIPVIPELESGDWRAVYGEMEFAAPHWSVFDNALDFAHIHYVHSGSFGNPDKPQILDMEIKKDTWALTGNFKIHNKPVNKLWEWTRVPHVPVEVRAFLPMTSAVKITLGGGVQMITYVNTVPIDENRSVNRFCLIRNFATSPLLDGFVKKEMFQILGEDKEIVETVNPEGMPAEYSLEPDVPQIMFRKLRQEWVDMGYAVDPNTTTGPNGTLNV